MRVSILALQGLRMFLKIILAQGFMRVSIRVLQGLRRGVRIVFGSRGFGSLNW